MDEREVREVDEVLETAGRAGSPVVEGGRLPVHGRVLPLGQAGRIPPRLIDQRDPDHSRGLPAQVAFQVDLEYPVEFGTRGDVDQVALHVVGPTVVGAVDATVLDPAERRRRPLVPADVHERPNRPLMADEEDPFAEELALHHLALDHITAVGDGMPEVPHGPVPLRVALGYERISKILHTRLGHPHLPSCSDPGYTVR